MRSVVSDNSSDASVFEQETRVERTEASAGHRFVTNLTDRWNIAGNPNGGYAVSSSLRAIGALTPTHPDPITITTHYLRPSQSNAEAEIDVEMIREGRRTSTLRSVMSQDGKERVTSLVTMSDLSHWVGPRHLAIPPRSLPEPDACVDRSTLPQGVDLPILSRVDVRLDPNTVEPGGSNEALIAGWIRLADGTAPSVMSLPLFADAFPPSPLSLLGRVGWIPTVELTVHVRARPQPGWIAACFQARDIGSGMLVEDGLLWDSAGVLVAQSRQLALLISD